MASSESAHEHAALVEWAHARGLIPAETADANLTLLTTLGPVAVKRFTPSKTHPYDHAKRFLITPLRVDTVDQMYGLLKVLGQCKHSLLLMEAPYAGPNPEGLRRKEFFGDIRAWLFLDIDAAQAPEGMDPTSPEAIDYVLVQLPEFLREVECVAQFTGSAGRSGNQIRLRLAFRLDRPVPSTRLLDWVKSHNAHGGALPIDSALFHSVQAHYTGAPVFENVEDPFDGRERVFKIPGRQSTVLASRIDVVTPQPEAADPVDRPAPRCGWTGEAADYLCDEENGGLGLHAAINRLTWEAAPRHGSSPTKTQLRTLADTIQSAALANFEAGLLPGRSVERIRAETSLDEIKRSYEGAINHGAVLRVPKGAAKNFDDALKDLRKAVHGELRVPGYTKSDWVWAAVRAGRARLGIQFTVDELRELLSEIAGSVNPQVFDRLNAFKADVLGSFDQNHSLHGLSVTQIESLDEVAFQKGGITAIRAPYGAGKTRNTGARFINEHSRSLLLVHRQSLARDLSRKLNILHYREPKMAEHLEAVGELVGGMAGVTVIDSLATQEEVRKAAEEVDGVIIDEAVQVLQHFNSETAKDRVKRIYELTQEVLPKPDVSILLMDAGLDTFTVEQIRDLSGKKVRVYELAQTRAGQVRLLRSCTKRRAPAALTAAVLEALRAGERVVVATDSKSYAKALHAHLREQGFRGGCITAGTPDAERREFESDPDEHPKEMGWEYLIYSPAIASGVSMESGWFTQVYGLYHGTITPHDFMQMLFRVRTVSWWTVAVVAKAAAYAPPAKTRAAGLRRLSGEAAVDEISHLLLRIEEREEEDRRWFGLKLVHALEALGLEIVRVDVTDDADVADELDALRAALREAEIDEVIEAEILDDRAAERLRLCDSKTSAESFALARWRICTLLHIMDPETLSAEEVQFVKDHQRVVDLLNCLTGARGRAMGLPWVRDAETGPLVLRPYLKHRAELYSSLLRELGVDPVTGQGTWGKEACREAVDQLAKAHADTLIAMGFTANVHERPQERVRRLLRRLGLAVVNHGSRRAPSYALDRASWSRAIRYAARVVEPDLLLSLTHEGRCRLGFQDLVDPYGDDRLEPPFLEPDDDDDVFDRPVGPTWLVEGLENGKPVLLSARWLQHQFGISERTAYRRLAETRDVRPQRAHRYAFEIDGAAVEALAKDDDAERVCRAVEMVTGATAKLLPMESYCQGWSISGESIYDSQPRPTTLGRDFHPPPERSREAASTGEMPRWMDKALRQFGLVVLDRLWIEKKTGVRRGAAYKRKSVASQTPTLPRYLARIAHPDRGEWHCEFLSGLDQPLIADALFAATGGHVKAISVVEDPRAARSVFSDQSAGGRSGGCLWQDLRAIGFRAFGKKDLRSAPWLWWKLTSGTGVPQARGHATPSMNWGSF